MTYRYLVNGGFEAVDCVPGKTGPGTWSSRLRTWVVSDLGDLESLDLEWDEALGAFVAFDDEGNELGVLLLIENDEFAKEID